MGYMRRRICRERLDTGITFGEGSVSVGTARTSCASGSCGPMSLVLTLIFCCVAVALSDGLANPATLAQKIQDS